MRNFRRAALWTLGGLIGTVAILLAGFSIVNSLTPIKLPIGPHVYIDAWDRGFVSASGTWTMENDRPAFPVQTSNIRCYRDDKSCTAAQAEITFGDTLHLETYNYDITKWDNTTILFRTDAACVEYIYTIDRANKRLLGTRTKKTNPDRDCSLIESKPLRLTLSDGFAVSRKLEEEASARVYPFMWLALGMWWLFVGYMAWPRKQVFRTA